MSEEVVSRLVDWGAASIDTVETTQSVSGERVSVTSIDFYTPFPGDQPIRSSITYYDGTVIEATIRYGVLDGSLYDEHPTGDTGQLLRLRPLADVAEMPERGIVMVNYGDTHRKPRPHLLFGWTPEGGGAVSVSDMEYLRREGYNEPVDAGQFMDWIIRVGNLVRQEFRGEWVTEN